MQEAAYSNQNSKTSSYGSYMQRDSFGNVYWTSRRMGGGGQVTAIEPADVLEAQPSDRWAAILGADLRPHFTTVSAQLWLKVNEYGVFRGKTRVAGRTEREVYARLGLSFVAPELRENHGEIEKKKTTPQRRCKRGLFGQQCVQIDCPQRKALLDDPRPSLG